MRKKWTKQNIISCLKKIKAEEGHIHRSYLRKHHDKLRGAIERFFGSFGEAIENAGFDPVAERGDCGSGFRGKKHSEKTKQVLSNGRKGKYVGEENPMYGKNHTKDTKDLISTKTKEWNVNNPDWQRGSKNHMFGKKQTTESNKKRSDTLKKYNSQFNKRPYKLTPEGRKKIQNARAKAISQQKSSFTDIEVIVKNSLDDLKIGYEFQYAFPYFCVDFYMPEHRCVLWCDGDYWHANPKLHKILTARQKTQHRLDKSQESYLTNRNISFLRLWGSDIKGNLNDCKNKILNLIKETI